MSIPIQRRFNRSAAAIVVPHPQKQSRISSLLLAWRMRSNSASGFCVG